MTLFWRRVGITAAAAIAVAGVVPGTAQADSLVHYKCEFVSIVFLNPMAQSFAVADGCEGPAGDHRVVFFDDSPPWAASTCHTGSAFQVAGKEGLDVVGKNCL